MNDKDKLLNTDEAAELLGVARNTVTTWITSGRLKAEKSPEDGRWYMTKGDVESTKEKKRLGKLDKSGGLQRDDDGLKDDPVLLLVKAIVKDELRRYQNCLSKGLETHAHEAYIRGSEFARITGGLIDPDELIRRMRLRFARRHGG